MISHDEAHELLPWLVNGTLAGPERARVVAHVDSCLRCRRAVQRERQLLALISAEPAADSAIDAGLLKLMRRIDSGSRGRARRSALPEQRLAPNTWVYAVLMLAAMGVALWLATPRDATEPAPPFTTVTDRQAAGLAQLDVVFADAIDAGQRNAVAQEVGARIVAGPSAAGRYTLELPADATEPTIALALERLRADARVQFAGRTYSAPATPTDSAP